MAEPVIDPAQANPEAGDDHAGGHSASEPDAATKDAAADAATTERPGDGIQAEYDLKLPEGSLLEPSALEEIAAYARENNLSSEEAQAMLDREDAAVAAFHEAQLERVDEIRSTWVKIAEDDGEIGGAEFRKNAELARRVVDRFGSDEFKKALKASGFGNHPEVIRSFVRIGKAMAEDRFIHSGSGAGGDPGNAAKILYPDMN